MLLGALKPAHVHGDPREGRAAELRQPKARLELPSKSVAATACLPHNALQGGSAPSQSGDGLLPGQTARDPRDWRVLSQSQYFHSENATEIFAAG